VTSGLVERHIAFLEALRAAGLPVSLAEDLDAVAALSALPWEHRATVHAAYAATLVKKQSQRPTFDALFDVYFPRLVGEGAHGEDTEEPETRTVLWYQIRLPETEVLRAGWVGAQQVQLDTPDEILYLEGDGRRFTGWVVFDQTKTKKGELKDNYIALMKNLSTEGPIDFTRLWILIYSPDQGRYISAPIDGQTVQDGLHGLLPVTIHPDHKGFTIRELDDNGKQVTIEYEAIRTDATHLRVRRLSPKIVYKKQPAKSKAKGKAKK